MEINESGKAVEMRPASLMSPSRLLWSGLHTSSLSQYSTDYDIQTNIAESPTIKQHPGWIHDTSDTTELTTWPCLTFWLLSTLWCWPDNATIHNNMTEYNIEGHIHRAHIVTLLDTISKLLMWGHHEKKKATFHCHYKNVWFSGTFLTKQGNPGFKTACGASQWLSAFNWT